MIADADGNVLARRRREEGTGYVVADVSPGRVAPREELPDRFWLHSRGAMPSFSWSYQRLHGRRWYAQHTFGRPPLTVAAHGSEAERAGGPVAS